MTHAHETFALCAQDLTATSGGDVPDWVHLLPVSGGMVRTNDARGPYQVKDIASLMAASLQPGDRLPIDENHATDLAAPRGGPAPARGWIVELQARTDGIWGRVEWTEEGRALVSSRAYRGISPVIFHPAKGSREIVAMRRASLVNTPNLQGMATLHQENTEMAFRDDVAGWLGLKPDATDEDFQTAITGLKGDEGTASLQSQIAEIGAALGVADGGDVLAAAKAAKAGSGAGDVAALQNTVASMQSSMSALQAENADLATKLNAHTGAQALASATAFVDGEIAKGRVGVKPLRDHYISMHQQDPARVEKEIGALPLLGATPMTLQPPAPADGQLSLNTEQSAAARLLGISQEAYLKTLQAEQQSKEAH